MDLEIWQWGLGGLSAFLIGLSKTGVPGVGILVVSLLAAAFGGRPSVGLMLPMLLFGDVFAVAWYRHHTQWDKLFRLFPWVVVGMAVGAFTLWATGKAGADKDILGRMIGGLVLAMLALHLLQGKLGERLTPRSKPGVAISGTMAGFATTISNAAGPVMAIYMAALQFSKKQFMGTAAWFFFIVNLAKVPVYVVLSLMNPEKPMMTLQSVTFDAAVFPAVLAGVLAGKWVLNRIPQRLFDAAVLVLAAAAAVKLLVF